MSTKKTESENTTDTDEVQLYDEGEPLASAESDNEEYSTSTNTNVDNKLAKKTTKLMTTPATMATSVHNEQEKKIQSGFAQALTQSSSTSKVSMQRDSSKKRGNETMPPAPATSTTSKTNTASTKPVNTTNGSEQKSIYYRLGDEQKARDTKALQEEAKKEKEVEELKASLKEKTALLKGQASTLEQKQKLLAEQEARIALLEEQMLQRKNAEPTPVPLPAKGNATSKKEEHMTVDHNDTYKGMQKIKPATVIVAVLIDRTSARTNTTVNTHTRIDRQAQMETHVRQVKKKVSANTCTCTVTVVTRETVAVIVPQLTVPVTIVTVTTATKKKNIDTHREAIAVKEIVENHQVRIEKKNDVKTTGTHMYKTTNLDSKREQRKMT